MFFREIREFMETGRTSPEPTIGEIREMILRHGRMLSEFKGEGLAMREMRKHVAWYTAGMPHSAGLRRQVNTLETYEQLEQLMERM